MNDTHTPQPMLPGLWRWKLVTIVLACTTGLLAFQLGRHISTRKFTANFAIVDLTDVVRKHQQLSITTISAGSADEDSRTRAISEAQAFGKQLDAAIIHLSGECQCVLLVREAVVAGQLDDLTPALKAKLELK